MAESEPQRTNPGEQRRTVWWLLIGVGVVGVLAALAGRYYINALCDSETVSMSGRLGRVTSVPRVEEVFSLNSVPCRATLVPYLVFSLEFSPKSAVGSDLLPCVPCKLTVKKGEEVLGHWQGIPQEANWHKPHTGACIWLEVPSEYLAPGACRDLSVSFEWLSLPSDGYDVDLWWWIPTHAETE